MNFKYSFDSLIFLKNFTLNFLILFKCRLTNLGYLLTHFISNLNLMSNQCLEEDGGGGGGGGGGGDGFSCFF